MSTSTVLGTAVTVQSVVTPLGVWALVVPGVQVVAPFRDLAALTEYAREQGIPAAGYRALPFLGLGVIATL
ncbi:hypothetical protein [Parafrankia elaeagni]|uniref:hypothetical protein n=1 Tax=Parafrankia elaeagni TaxID=222534 RepID=UPI0004767B20|nr:hypothetical protein [Parafrankia elaeagni]